MVVAVTLPYCKSSCKPRSGLFAAGRERHFRLVMTMNSMTKKQKNLLLRIAAAAVMMAVLFALQRQDGSPVQQMLRKRPALCLLLYLVPYFTVGYDILRKALKGIRNHQVFDENFLMAVATVGAMALGEYSEAVAVMLFYQIGELFQSYAVGKSRRNIGELMDIRPDYANLVIEEETKAAAGKQDSSRNADPETAGKQERSGKTAAQEEERQDRIEKVDPDDVEIGSIILVQPGERVPIDGIVVEGSSALDTSALTGESVPRDVGKGQEILSGSINLSGVLKVRTTKEFGESTASRILDLVENAGSRKARSEQFITKFARWYTPAVCFGALALAVLGPVVSMLVFHVPGGRALWGEWIYRALTFLVISCPCAIVVSIPLTFFGGIGGAGSKGILIKGSNFMETLANVRTVVFDKTGTLTKGNFVVTKICPAHGAGDADCGGLKEDAERGNFRKDAHKGDPQTDTCRAEADPAGALAERGSIGEDTAGERLLKFAALAEIYSSHPISRSLKEAYKKPLVSARIGKSREISGKGVITQLDGQPVAVGNLQLMQDLGIGILPEDDHTAVETGTVVHVAVGKEYLGHIVISDELKPGAAQAVRELKAAGVTRTVMLTGDAESIAAHVASQLGIDEYHAQLLPEDKVSMVEKLLAGGKSERETSSVTAGTLAFVGDGINDAPVLSRADIGIAMGALGSDAAIEAADVVLMDDDPVKIAGAVRIARKCIRIVNENIWFAIGVKLLCLLLGAMGIANMWLAIFADVGVMVLCVLNAIRALS